MGKDFTDSEGQKFTFCEHCDTHHYAEQGVCKHVEPRKSYYIVNEGGESGYSVAIFRRSEVEDTFGPITPDTAEERIAQLVGWSESYRGPGRSFSNAPTLRLMKRNVVIRQFSGLDI